MAFLDELGSKISDAGQAVANKTKSVTDIAKLTMQISEEKKKLETIYAQLGAAYYEKHTDDCESSFTGYIRDIKEHLQSIEQANTAILKAKGLTICPKCGSEIPENSVFCAECGENISQNNSTQAIGENEMLCSKCGKVIANNMKFCIFCGNPVPAERVETPEQPIEQESRDISSTSKKLCPNCKSEISEGMLFCIKCGCKLN